MSEIELAKRKAMGRKEKVLLPWRPNDNPSVGRPLCLPTILEQVISVIEIESTLQKSLLRCLPKVQGQFIVLKKFLPPECLDVITLKLSINMYLA